MKATAQEMEGQEPVTDRGAQEGVRELQGQQGRQVPVQEQWARPAASTKAGCSGFRNRAPFLSASRPSRQRVRGTDTPKRSLAKAGLPQALVPVWSKTEYCVCLNVTRTRVLFLSGWVTCHFYGSCFLPGDRAVPVAPLMQTRGQGTGSWLWQEAGAAAPSACQPQTQ